MEDLYRHSWQDPLLLTDVSSQQQQQFSSYTSCTAPTFPDLLDSPMQDEIPEDIYTDPIVESMMEGPYPTSPDVTTSLVLGREILEFSLTSPDLMTCAESPEIPKQSYGESPEIFKGSSIEVSLENGIKGSEIKDSNDTPASAKFSTFLSLSKDEFELPPPPVMEEFSPVHLRSMVTINVGSTDCINFQGDTQFSKDKFFTGGDTIRTDAIVGDGGASGLYQSARFGNFLYNFEIMDAGCYLVDLHFAEIVLTNGPPGMRVFDVYIQEQKVISSLDIYACVGANKPLVISDLEAHVNGEEGLCIRFEGIIGLPIVSGISVRKKSGSEEVELHEISGCLQLPQSKSWKAIDHGEEDGDAQRVKLENNCLEKELEDTKRQLEELKRLNEQKSRECQEACKSLEDLQNELMRKSMHVGSLAFAIEGQVKEKTKWFSSLRDLTRKMKIMKMDQIKLSEEALSFKQCIADMTDMGSLIQSKLKQHVELHEDLKNKFIKGAKEKRELYNKVLELKGNIRVFCRCRPLNVEEIAMGASMAIDFEAAKEGELTVKSNGLSKKTFKFDAVFSPQAEQVEVFEDTAPFAASVLDGYNVCIFAYGQTGTGKTFTMEGTKEARGVNYRTLEELFRIIEERNNTFQYEISVSVMEVYNEQIRDLLVSEAQTGVTTTKRLEIKQVGEGVHHVPGLVEAQVNNMNEVWEVLQTGSNSRAVGSTNANEHSSRSHCIHCVMVKGENLLNGECTRSKLWLIDLAGSERIAKTEVQGERLKETQNINRSLSALGDVISALANKSPHIPFRNSKLTHLLQDSLGGDSKTLMFVQISPNENDVSETLCSLNFASRVRGIELGPAKKQLDNTELLKYKQMVEKNKQEMKTKDFQVKKMEDTVHGLEMKMKEKDLKVKSLQDKIKEMESQLLVERKLARQQVDSRIAEQLQQQQHLRQQHEDQNSSRPPFATKTTLAPKTSYDENKSQINLPKPLSENNNYKLSVDPLLKQNDLAEKEDKENNPGIEQLLMPKRAWRASLCPTVHKLPATSAPRRNSLIPLPSVTGAAKLPLPFLPLAPIQANEEDDVGNAKGKCLPEPVPGDSPTDQKIESKKLHSALRRSIQKRIQMKSPMQHIRRGGGLNLGTEKVRISIGSRRVAHRVLLGNARRGVTKEGGLQKQSQREKERGWNIGTATRGAVL
ncbi:kinesin-like protein KIN-14Q [Ipomoea triloba]|uniref:kinesin-like protein KIN-14Q n=1 Tax=Ipomoea triloba TaxID=35885 RepID=UPI00125E7F51|nr:kinesin-like protein KIN-14Q [Ipomoea triloba]